MAANALHGIAKLSGSFAIGGLVVKELCFTSSEDSLLPFAGLLWPKEAHALSISLKGSTRQPPRVRPFFALDEFGRATKVYPSEQRLRSIYSQFSPTSLASALGRGIVFTYAPVVDAYFRSVREAEQKAADAGEEWDYDDAPEFDYASAREKVPAAALAVVKEVLVGITRIVLSWLAVDHLDERLAWKMVKDQIPAIRAKIRFPFYQRPYHVVRTFVRSSVIPVAAEFLVSSTIITIRICRRSATRNEKRDSLLYSLTALPLRQTCILAASAIGAGVASAIRPGILCSLAAIAAGYLMDVFVCQPAETLYSKEGRVTTDTKLIVAGCGIIILMPFVPWIQLPSSIEGLFQEKQLAVA